MTLSTFHNYLRANFLPKLTLINYNIISYHSRGLVHLMAHTGPLLLMGGDALT